MTEAERHIQEIADPRRKKEAVTLDALFRAITGYEPRLWAGRMVGYGSYDYTYESGRSGTFLATGFAISARQVTVYIMPGYTPFPDIMGRLGTYKHGKSCLYITRLEKIDIEVLKELIRAGLDDLATRWAINPT